MTDAQTRGDVMRTSAALTPAVGAMVTLAAAAHADQASFLADVQNEGAFGQLPPHTIQVLGQEACQRLARADDTLLNAFESGIAGVAHASFQDSVQFVVLAARDLCPNAAGNTQPQASAPLPWGNHRSGPRIFELHHAAWHHGQTGPIGRHGSHHLRLPLQWRERKWRGFQPPQCRPAEVQPGPGERIRGRSRSRLLPTVQRQVRHASDRRPDVPPLLKHPLLLVVGALAAAASGCGISTPTAMTTSASTTAAPVAAAPSAPVTTTASGAAPHSQILPELVLPAGSTSVESNDHTFEDWTVPASWGAQSKILDDIRSQLPLTKLYDGLPWCNESATAKTGGPKWSWDDGQNYIDVKVQDQQVNIGRGADSPTWGGCTSAAHSALANVDMPTGSQLEPMSKPGTGVWDVLMTGRKPLRGCVNGCRYSATTRVAMVRRSQRRRLNRMAVGRHRRFFRGAHCRRNSLIHARAKPERLLYPRCEHSCRHLCAAEGTAITFFDATQ